jgi:CheY-like chemotaxis protein
LQARLRLVPPPSASDATPAVVRLHPIRVLVVGTDLAFHERANDVFADLGPVAFTAAASDGGDELLAVVRAQRPDVVVLDATGREAATGRLVVALAESGAPVGVVVVCEQATAAARRLGALPKWGWTQDLRRAVELASLGERPQVPDGFAAAARPPGPLAGWAEDGPAPAPEAS